MWLLLWVVLFNSQVFSRQHCHLPKLDAISLADIHNGYETGCITALSLVEAYISRINELDILHTVIEINPEARTIATELDRERNHGRTRGPLHGVPILVKDNIGTADCMNTTAGSFALLGAKTTHDSTVVQKLRKAGAIILGKANLSEWANARGNSCGNGWSARGGQCTGAFIKDQDPGGSSSGSAVATVLGLAFATLGTDTGGSILNPSSYSSVVGIRPTRGLTSRHLVVPYSLRQDTIGPISRNARDAATILTVIAGPDNADNYTLPNPHPRLDYANFPEDPDTIFADARIGVPDNVLAIASSPLLDPYGWASQVLPALDGALQTMIQHGATVTRNANFTALNKIVASFSSVGLVASQDSVSDLEIYLSQLSKPPIIPSSPPQNLDDIRRFTQHFPPEEYPKKNTSFWDVALAGPPSSSSQVWKQYQTNLYLAGPGAVTGAIDRLNLDAIVLPTTLASLIAPLAGLPAVTVPLGFLSNDTQMARSSSGLIGSGPGYPFGFSFVGKRWSDKRLLALAHGYQSVSDVSVEGRLYISPTEELKPPTKGRHFK